MPNGYRDPLASALAGGIAGISRGLEQRGKGTAEARTRAYQLGGGLIAQELALRERTKLQRQLQETRGEQALEQVAATQEAISARDTANRKQRLLIAREQMKTQMQLAPVTTTAGQMRNFAQVRQINKTASEFIVEGGYTKPNSDLNTLARNYPRTVGKLVKDIQEAELKETTDEQTKAFAKIKSVLQMPNSIYNWVGREEKRGWRDPLFSRYFDYLSNYVTAREMRAISGSEIRKALPQALEPTGGVTRLPSYLYPQQGVTGRKTAEQRFNELIGQGMNENNVYEQLTKEGY